MPARARNWHHDRDESQQSHRPALSSRPIARLMAKVSEVMFAPKTISSAIAAQKICHGGTRAGDHRVGTLAGSIGAAGVGIWCVDNRRWRRSRVAEPGSRPAHREMRHDARSPHAREREIARGPIPDQVVLCFRSIAKIQVIDDAISPPGVPRRGEPQLKSRHLKAGSTPWYLRAQPGS